MRPVWQCLLWGWQFEGTLKNAQWKKSNKCSQCDYASFLSRRFEQTLKRHSGEKSNKCNQCDFAYSDPSSLWRHLKTQNGEKSNKCNQCDYASFQAGNLRTHLKTHSGEKLNKCNQCDFAYDLIYQSNLPSLPTYRTSPLVFSSGSQVLLSRTRRVINKISWKEVP